MRFGKLEAASLALGALLSAALAADPSAIRFVNFASRRQISLVGAAAIAGKTLRLTPAKHDRSGAAWFHEKQPVGNGFDTTFQFRLTHQGGQGRGADGFAFVIQNSGPEAVGGPGSAGGFAVSDRAYQHRDKAIPWSIAVFFDTFKNDDEDDPSANYVSFCTYGKPSDMRWPASRLAFTPNLAVELKDRNTHTARILFRPPLLSVFLDDFSAAVLESTVDLSIVVDRAGAAWVGFTASTGGGYENHDILNWSFNVTDVSTSMSVVSSDISFPMSACLPDRHLCTPEQPLVEQTAVGYHIVLPANLEWGASIPNPSARAVEVANAKGIVCWDVKARGPEGCGGPSGNGAVVGSGFLAEEQPAGALITQTRGGRTWFSVNGRGGSSFHRNEGFYEFDVLIH